MSKWSTGRSSIVPNRPQAIKKSKNRRKISCPRTINRQRDTKVSFLSLYILTEGQKYFGLRASRREPERQCYLTITSSPFSPQNNRTSRAPRLPVASTRNTHKRLLSTCCNFPVLKTARR